VTRWFAGAVLLVAVVLSGGALALAQGTPAVEVHKVDESHFAPSPDGTVFVLVLGIDGRPGIDTDRADAIHVVGINPAAGAATVLDIPRDTWANIPGRRASKINDSYTLGGPDLSAKAVGALVGVDVRYVVVTTFASFPKMVDEIGGIQLAIERPMHDRYSGTNFEPGVRQMNGGETFAFTRDRHSFGDGDIDRTNNQGRVIQAAHAKLRGEGVTAANVVTWLGILGRNTKITGGATMADLYRLGRWGLSVDPAKVRNVVMPSRIGMVGSASVVFPGPAAGGLFADFRDDAVLQAH
jgi:LCP family protein required for cell wall assembly